ncbi:MAG: hypothetical protein ABFS38_06180 [Bacteroidota bacterium]
MKRILKFSGLIAIATLLLSCKPGSLEFGKSVVAEVLSRRIERGLLTKEIAKEMIQCIFRENAIEVFQLEERLNREF